MLFLEMYTIFWGVFLELSVRGGSTGVQDGKNKELKMALTWDL